MAAYSNLLCVCVVHRAGRHCVSCILLVVVYSLLAMHGCSEREVKWSVLCGRTVDVAIICVLNIACRSAIENMATVRNCKVAFDKWTSEHASFEAFAALQFMSSLDCWCSTFWGSMVVSSARVEMSSKEWTPRCRSWSTNYPVTRRHILEERRPEFGSIS